MKLRTGKYAGQSSEDVSMMDPGYYRWMRLNRPEMLVERKAKPKAEKVELTEEELDQKNNYKTLTKLSWKEAF